VGKQRVHPLLPFFPLKRDILLSYRNIHNLFTKLCAILCWETVFLYWWTTFLQGLSKSGKPLPIFTSEIYRPFSRYSLLTSCGDSRHSVNHPLCRISSRESTSPAERILLRCVRVNNNHGKTFSRTSLVLVCENGFNLTGMLFYTFFLQGGLYVMQHFLFFLRRYELFSP